jgi:hypothetical protein
MNSMTTRRTHASRCRSGVDGLRAWLKPRRFWFDSRGRHRAQRDACDVAAARLRSSNAEQPVLTRKCVGSSPTGGTFVGELDAHHPLDARAVQRLNAGSTCRRSLVRSQPRAPRRVLPEARNPVFYSGKHGFDSVCDTSRTTPSSNGSGSEFTNLRTVVRVHPESLLGLRSGIRLVSKTDQRGSIPRWPANMASSLPGGGVGFIRRTCRVRSPGLLPTSATASSSPGGDGSPTYCMRRVRSPGSLPPVPLAQRPVLSPDERPTNVRLVHGTR